MKKKLSIFLFFSGLIFILSSCENLLVKELDLEDFDFKKQLVLNSAINSTSDSIVAFISENVSILNSEERLVFIENATVDLFFEGIKIADLQLGNDKRYHYKFMDANRPIGNYEMVVNHPIYGEVTANTEIPVDVPILDLKFIEDAGYDPLLDNQTSAIQFKIIDPPGKQYYAFQILTDQIVQDTFIDGTDTFYYETQISIDPSMIADPNIANNQNGKYYVNDDTFDGKEYLIYIRFAVYNFNLESVPVKELFKLKWEVLSKDYYNFNTSLDKYFRTSDFGLFSEPVTVHSNVQNGLGIFAGVNSKIYGF